MTAPTATYKRILQLLDKWPVDPGKVGTRDLGEFLRDFVNLAYKQNKFEEHPKYWDRQYLAIRKLVENEHKLKYKRSLNSSATGLNREECNAVLSNELLEELEQEERSFFKRLFSLGPEKKRLSTVVLENIHNDKSQRHVPVMLSETLSFLKPSRGEVILDMTFGGGGHSRQILQSCPEVKLLCLDRDPTAHSCATRLAEEYPDRVVPLLGKFSDLPDLLGRHNVRQNSVDSVLFDFGCSSMQFEDGERGFSVVRDGPLDMRMDGNRDPEAPTAADVLARASEEDIYKIIKYYGEEKQARKIARAIIDSRYLFKKLETTKELADVVETACTENFRTDMLNRRTHVATKTFQALRIFVNNELNEINYGLILSHRYLKIGGRLVTITFHSLEDTIVKRHLMGNVLEYTANVLPLKYCSHVMNIDQDFMMEVMDPKWKMLHKHVLVPKYEEIEENPRSRSAKLRAAVKVKH